MSKDIRQRVFQTMGHVFQVGVEKINESSSTDTIEKWDSLKHMNLVLALEEEFQVQFKSDQIVKMVNTGLIIKTLQELGVH